jgi:cbb3-type cytochrome c oxidase subunit III
MRCWSVQLRAICLVSVAAVAGCGGERRSGAASAGDTAVVSGADTAGMRAADTTAAPAADTMARHDTAAAPPVARPTPAKKTPPKPAAQKPPAQSQPAPAESSTAAAPQPADTTATIPAQTEASAPLRDAYHTAPLDTVSQEVYTGWKQFNLNCARCHGEDVQGTTIAPHLIVSLRPDGPINTKEIFVQTVCAGRPEKGMPAWCALGLDMEKINQIYAYVKGRSDSKIHPGRPAVKAGG